MVPLTSFFVRLRNGKEDKTFGEEKIQSWSKNNIGSEMDKILYKLRNK